MERLVDRSPDAVGVDREIGADLDVVIRFLFAMAADRVAWVSPRVALVVLDDRTTELFREELPDMEDAFTGDDNFHGIPTTDPWLSR